jgi:hypothetical protein
MTDKAISPLRQRMIEDMTIRKLAPPAGEAEWLRIAERREAGRARG